MTLLLEAGKPRSHGQHIRVVYVSEGYHCPTFAKRERGCSHPTITLCLHASFPRYPAWPTCQSLGYAVLPSITLAPLASRVPPIHRPAAPTCQSLGHKGLALCPPAPSPQYAPASALAMKVVPSVAFTNHDCLSPPCSFPSLHSHPRTALCLPSSPRLTYLPVPWS